VSLAVIGRLARTAAVTALRFAIVVAVVSCLVFVLADLLPGDASTGVVERGSSSQTVTAVRARLGLDRPRSERLLEQLGGLAHADLGTTARGRPVRDVIAEPLARTLLLGGLAFAIVALIGIGVGTLLAWRSGRAADRVIGVASTVVLCLPEFVVLTLLTIVLARWLGWLPAVVVPASDGAIAAQMLVLPVLGLALPTTAWTVRIVRGAVADVIEMPHVQTALLDGLQPARILARHVLPLALPAITASLATSCATLFGGAIVVETFANYPGLGSVLSQGVEARDVPLVTGVIIVVTIVMVAAFAAADLVRGLLPAVTPR
jgi:peptide/nickel transport system permease protein